MSYIEHLFLRHRHPDCLLLPRVGYNIWTIVIYHHFLLVIHLLINYIRVFNTEETESAFRNAFYTSVALVVSTFIYGRTPANLSLVDGLVVTFLPLLITTGAVYNAIIILKGKVTLQVAYMMHFIAMIAFGLTVWAHVDTYGTTPGCNLNSSVKFVVFGHTVAATNKRLRKFAIFTFVFSAVFIPLNALIFVIKQWAFPDADTDTDSNSSSDLGWIIALITWPMTILMCAVWVYDVVTIEQIIQRNGFSQATSQWTYGQTFAVVLMLGPVIDLGSALGRRMRRNSGERSCPRCSTKRADQNRENPQHQVG